MRTAIVTNVAGAGSAGRTTFRLAARLLEQGHEVHLMTVGGLACEPDDSVRALARRVPPSARSPEQVLRALVDPTTPARWVTVDDLDVLLLRGNPSVQAPWVRRAALTFGRLAVRRGVLVLNDPDGLGRAADKLYLQTFPTEVRPRTLVTRSAARVAAFADGEGTIVVKPLEGSGGRNVFLVRPVDRPNLEQIIGAVARDGFVVAQEYVEAAARGDTRLLLMNGAPLKHRGRYAAVRRIRTGGDVRSNVHAGGRIRRAAVDDAMLELAEAVRPRLVEDGMFLVGLDIAGTKILEINVFSPGGLGGAQHFEHVDFTRPIVADLERKVQRVGYDGERPSNAVLATS